MQRTKTFRAQVKLAGEEPDETPDESTDDSSDDSTDETSSTTSDKAGTFEALVSVFGVKDSYGEIVMPGAFTRTLSEWEQSGDPIPVYWSHRLDDPDFNIGHVLEAKETPEGLYVKAQLDLDNAKAKATHNLMRQRRVTQFSFSFAVPPGGAKEGEDAIELTDVDLFEVGPTPVGANPDTELIGVKSGRVLSAKTVETIETARDALKKADAALTALLKLNSDTDKSSNSKVKIEEPVMRSAYDVGGWLPPGKVKIEEPTLSIDSVLAQLSLVELEQQ